MKKELIIACCLCLARVAVAQVPVSGFQNPPLEARPSTYWEWMNGNISKEGLTLDLEYMKRANYGAAMIFETGVGIPRGAVDYNSASWEEMMVHVVQEAERLSLKLSMHNSPGYSGTGGPWIPVEHSMKQLVWTDAFATANRNGRIEVELPMPHSKMGFYRDVCVLAYPSLPGERKGWKESVRRVTLDGEPQVADVLSDRNLDSWIRLEKRQSLLFELDEPFEAQAATLFRGEREQPLDPHDGPRDYPPSLLLEASEDGENFVELGQFNCPPLREMDAPGTLSFRPVKARYFRMTSNRGTNLAEVELHSSPRIVDYASKTNYTGASASLRPNRQQVDREHLIAAGQVVDVTRYIDKDGHLSWQASAGENWTLVRIGYTTTGEVVAAAPDAGVGLDCDKFSKEALDVHFDRFMDPLLEKLKAWCGTTLEALVIDSWEAGKQNWTERLPDYFKRKRGYEIMPYMLAVTGRIVDNVESTERFLWDFRRTHADMFLENYVEHFKERASRYGLKYAGEAYGDGNFESLEMASRQDCPMSEFWTHYIYGNVTTTMMAASTAHVWNKPVVACECYTGTPFNSKFTEHPYGMKALGDYIMTAGVNRFVYHATTHQPYTGVRSGCMMTMGPFGTHLDRTSTWAGEFAALNLYNARCAYMLQQGKYVADVLYLKDEAVSSGVGNYNIAFPATPYGYRWDIADAIALQQRLAVKEGRIVLPDGMTYSMLVVTPMERTSPETLKRIIELVEQGMTVFLAGDKPGGYLGLNTRKDEEVRRLADKLWGSGTIGKGRVYKQVSSEEMFCKENPIAGILNAKGISPDFSFVAEHKDALIHFIHRRVGSEEVYFVTNQRRRQERLTVTCRVTGKVPLLWNAETGETDIPVAYRETDGRTQVNLELPESGSVFIVFSDRSDKTDARNFVETEPKPLSEPLFDTFTVSFWAKPETFAAGGRGFLLFPDAGESRYGKGHAVVGLSMGQNGVKVYERASANRMVLESLKPVEGWTHIALVYHQGTPTLYLNGEVAGQGVKSAFVCSPACDVPMADEQYIACFEGDQTPACYDGNAWTAEEVRADMAKGIPAPPLPEGRVLQELDESWIVRFPAGSKAPGEVMLPRLLSLHKHEDFNVRHFSGKAVYRKDFSLSRSDLKKARKVLLDLGRVENLAKVSVNGSESLLLWKAPYRLDITRLVKRGVNRLEVEVTNLYPNRLIGDEHLPERYEYDEYGRIRQLPQWYRENTAEEASERVLFLPWKYYKKDDPLLEAGLLGPVRIVVE